MQNENDLGGLKVRSKFAAFGTSIFTEVTAKANACGAVNLAQGFPSFDGPLEMKQAAIEAILNEAGDPRKNQYAPSVGIPLLREKLSERKYRQSGLRYDPEKEISVYSGATEALYCAFQTFFTQGDEIIVFEPFFDCYVAGIFSVGAKLVPVRLKAPEWSFNENDLQKAVNSKTKAILVNTPHNPTGKVFSVEELHWIAHVAEKNDLLIITDEVYEELVFEGKHVSMAEIPGARKRTLVLSSSGKTFSATGWKVGFSFASAELTHAMRLCHQFTVFSSATPLQWGVAAALSLPDSFFDTLRQEYRERLDTLLPVLRRVGFAALKPQGSFFIMASYRDLSSEDDRAFALRMLTDVGVAALPTSVFYQQLAAEDRNARFLRFAFCKDRGILSEACRRLEAKQNTLSRIREF